ncbi:hypothetical protein M9Y10_026446 [Tritrichomonas musculus]|uniref:Protein kinase domain-containing protein n=1 Tax=Tritrichomonas musculus TaxID=1915356 RepID=A0ABR2H7L0_9EUKA
MFQDIAQEYITKIIKNDVKIEEQVNENIKMLSKIYSMFSFKRLNPSLTYAQVVSPMIDFLKNFKFITCYLYPHNLSNNDVSNSRCETAFATICDEEQCIIIEKIDISTIDQIINEVKKNGSVVIKVNNGGNSTGDNQSKEEIDNFVSYFSKEIKNKEFIRKTIRAVACYIIRRFFYPTEYFKNPSFFYFNKSEETNNSACRSIFKNKYKEKIFDFLKAKKNNKDQQILKNKYDDFSEEDFIFLRNIYSNGKAKFNLVMHKESLYIFAMKKTTKLCHEESFCKNYSHRCLTRFYGFLKKEEKTVGFIYEFMSNGSLDSYVESNRDKMSELFSMMTINRIIQGIDYLHSNSLIHRDLKPANILLDHDFIPYISDFETIRHPIGDDESDDEMTNDIGSYLYASPEQNGGRNVSYPTDIYSFGKIISFMFNNLENKTKKSCFFYESHKFQEVYDKCIQNDQEDRFSIEEIISILYDEFIIFLIQNLYINSEDESQMFQFSFEVINIMKYQSDTFTLNFFNFLLNSHNESEALVNLGNLYYDGLGVERNYSKAKEYYELSAKQNNSSALFNLGSLYANGHGVEQNYSKAKEYYELSAKQNNSYALVNLGNLYYNGHGVEQNYSQAKEYYELSAKQNNSDALVNLGNLYENGLGVERNYSKAREYYELSAKQNNSSALFSLGNLYANGHGVEQNYSKAKEYYELSAKQNNSYALFNLGSLYKNGLGVEQNYSKAREHYELSAKQNDSDALFSLGNLYANNHGIEQNYSKAKEYYELSAKQNNSYALLNLGSLYANGLGVEQNYCKAREYYELSAKQNNSKALFNLGSLYKNGLGVERNYSKAREYYELSAKQNDSYALFSLGNLYANGHGVEQNYSKAKGYYELSAKQNNSDVLFSLGYLYANGLGVEQNYSKAKEYYELSAKQNNSKALVNLGNLYYNGHGVEQNYSKAREYYELSTKQNDSDALFSFGYLYENGHGVEQNYSATASI